MKIDFHPLTWPSKGHSDSEQSPTKPMNLPTPVSLHTPLSFHAPHPSFHAPHPSFHAPHPSFPRKRESRGGGRPHHPCSQHTFVNPPPSPTSSFPRTACPVLRYGACPVPRHGAGIQGRGQVPQTTSSIHRHLPPVIPAHSLPSCPDTGAGIHPRPSRGRPSTNLVIHIRPCWITTLNQLNLPSPVPFLECLLLAYSTFHSLVNLVPN